MLLGANIFSAEKLELETRIESVTFCIYLTYFADLRQLFDILRLNPGV